jgi:hypothetical protein
VSRFVIEHRGRERAGGRADLSDAHVSRLGKEEELKKPTSVPSKRETVMVHVELCDTAAAPAVEAVSDRSAVASMLFARVGFTTNPGLYNI